MDFITGNSYFVKRCVTIYPYQMMPGCDCCVFNGSLVEDKHTWIVNNKTYGRDKQPITAHFYF